MPERATRTMFGRGFGALVPLWLGVVPFGLAYAITARGAGLSLVETQALSAFVFAGSAQLSAVGLFAGGAAGLEIVLPPCSSTCGTPSTEWRSSASCR